MFHKVIIPITDIPDANSQMIHIKNRLNSSRVVSSYLIDEDCIEVIAYSTEVGPDDIKDKVYTDLKII